MISPSTLWLDTAGTIVSFLLTVMVFSYLFGDNIFFRFAMHVLVGVSSGFAFVVCLYSVIWAQLILPYWGVDVMRKWLLIIPILLSVLLFTNVLPRISGLGKPVLALVAGVGAAIAVAGSVWGTIVPQVLGTLNQVSFQKATPSAPGSGLLFINGLIFLVGTISTLVYFHFGSRADNGSAMEMARWMNWLAEAGRIFLAITLGALFAGVFLASMAAFVDRISFLVKAVVSFIT